MRARYRSVVALSLAALFRVGAQTPAPATARPADPGSELTISLLTMGHGKEVWELFGHNAIWIHDASTGRDVAYNWGVFDSTQPHFILHFLQGLMIYAMDGYGIDETLAQYRYLNRSVWAQELNLTPAQRAQIRTFIEWNRRPENVRYRYDYFRDNCSTRVRDILDRALGGQMQAAATKKLTGTTYRWHVLRLMQEDKPLVSGVDIGLGEPSDRELSAWEEMFLPSKLRDFVRTLRVPDGQGGTQPLVKNERVLFQATRPPEPERPPMLGIPFLVIGILIAGLILGVGARSLSGRRQARLASAVILGFWSLVAGVLGVLLTLLWAVTDHMFAHRNENLLLFNPLWLVLAVAIPIYFARGTGVRFTRALAWSVAGLAVLAAVLHAVTLSSQSNWAVIGLGLPPALACAWVVTRPAAHVRQRGSRVEG